MDSFFFLLCSSFLFFLVFVSGAPFTEFIYPNFTASNLDTVGTFLFSRNGAFKAAIFNPGSQQNRFYLSVIHTDSNTVIWSGNRNSPVSKSGNLIVTRNGISITEENGNPMWSTPPFNSSASALQLTESGNLVLLDRSNATLWNSFDNPTDTIVIGQKYPLGTVLFSSVSKDDFSNGDYSFALTPSDAVLQWLSHTYWILSMDTKAYVVSNYGVEYMSVNQTGLYLFGKNGSTVVIQVNLQFSEFRAVKIDESGQFTVVSFSNGVQKMDFVMPVDQCRIPYICGKIGLCTTGISIGTPVCSCPSSFRANKNNNTNCVPSDSSYSLPVLTTCNSTDGRNRSNFTYLPLGYGVNYFANDFIQPSKRGVNLSFCQDLCSNDCSCWGVFYENSSGSCYTMENEIGSVMLRNTGNEWLGFVKAILRSSSSPSTDFGDGYSNDALGFPTVAVVFLPVSGLLFLFVIGICLWRKYRFSKVGIIEKSSFYSKSKSLEDLEFSIPGLPTRFEYVELQKATNNFKTQIGTGGFGTVYRGVLPNKTPVAVKKIINLGIRGKKEFCSEIAIIGNIHHVNLVKLIGYCAQKSQWLLVYEYMNRGSLDKTLFGNGPVLEWEERVRIALGAARGLAYLHNGCEHKIIHCDVKPENILLHDNFQTKISDFGLSKLLTREESSLFTTMRGTRGYLAPEWLTSSAISDKTDVYSFGMVLLEIVSGRKNCGSAQVRNPDWDKNTGPVYFPLYALEMHEKKRYLELVDERLEGRVGSEEVEKVVRVALCCVHEEPGLRPSMVNVVGMLEGEVGVGEPRVESLNFLRFYGRRFAEASTLEEENRGSNEAIMYPDANASYSSNRSVSDPGFSYISSQQISGPR